jgi:hypothetical protein
LRSVCKASNTRSERMCFISPSYEFAGFRRLSLAP